jgi:mannan endo-1,4-beta-mannosidase
MTASLLVSRTGLGRHRSGSVGSLPQITRSGTTLQKAGTAFRFAGANMYWLGVDDNSGNLSSVPGYPTHAMIDAGLQEAATLGVTVVRAHTLGISLPGYPDTSLSLLTSSGGYNTAAFEPIDYAFHKAAALGIYLWIPLVDQWRYFHGGKWNFVHLRAGQSSQFVNPTLPTTVSSTSAIVDTLDNTTNNPPNAAQNSSEQTAENQFYSSLLIRSDFEAYVAEILGHVNQYTGIKLGADPVVLAWETGNEIYSATVEWTQSIATYIKTLTSALVADGSAADGLAVSSGPGVSCAAVDIVGGHYYPSAGTALVGSRGSQLTADANAAVSAGKVFAAMEYPWANTSSESDLAAWLTQIEGNANITGASFWSIVAPGDTHGSGEGSNDAAMFVPGTDSQMTSSISALEAFAGSMTNTTPSAPTAFTAANPPAATVSTAYAYTFAANGYPTPTYTVATGSVPAGLTLSSTGALTGTPTSAGSSTFTVKATNTAGSFTTGGLTVTVGAASSNLLPAAAATPTTATLFTTGGATASQSIVTTQTALAAQALEVAFSGTGYPYTYINPPTDGAPVTAGTAYTGIVSVMVSSGTSGLTGGEAVISWYTTAGAFLSTSSAGTYEAFSAATPVQLAVTATAPSTAAYAVLQVQPGQSAAIGDELFIAKLGLYLGTTAPTWTA